MPIISNLPKKKFTQTDGDNRYLQLSGASAMQGDLDVGGNKITNIGTPSESTDAANKGYVDTHVNDALEGNYIPTSEKGTANGVAELDSTGRVPSTQLPSYVDDVLEYASFSNFPQTGEDGKIYVAEDTNRQYRWSGSQYVEISPSLALGETSSTAYRGDRGAIAYTHSQTTGNPHNTTAAEVGAVPTSRTVNGHALSDNISLTADDVGARSTNWTPTAADVGAVPTNRTVNGKALSANITLNASDVGAATEAQVEAAKPMLVTIAGNDGSYTADKTPAEIIAAYQAGQTIYAVYNNVRVPMCELLDGYICIFTLDYGTMYDVFIYEYEGSVSVEVTETPAKVTTFKNVSIFTTTMTWSTHSIAELNEQGYTQRVAIPLSHITLSHSPTLVSFSVADRYSGNWSDYCDTYDGGLYLYAKAQQAATIDNAVFTLID